MSTKSRFLEVLKRNEDIYRKFFEIETEILTVLDFGGLFHRLVSLIKAKFAVRHAWIAVVRDGDVARMLGEDGDAGDAEAVKDVQHPVFVDHGKVCEELRACEGPILASGDLSRFQGLLPVDLSLPYGSMALAPLTLDGKLAGCLIQADADPERFSPDMDTTLLSQLAVKVSLCLSNVTAHERLARIASRDPLTGLLNRRVMEERLHEEYLRAVRYGAPLSVAFVDMDDFKQVNDTLGHDAGDALLAHFAERLKHMARKIDICARFAGDEFVVILPNTTREQARTFMDRVERYFAVSPVPDLGLHARFSVGVSSTEDAAATSPERLLKLADQELFGQKACRHAAERMRPKRFKAAGA